MKYDRFIQEVKEPIVLNSAHIAGAYLMRSIFAPFEKFEQEEFWALPLTVGTALPTKRWSIGA